MQFENYCVGSRRARSRQLPLPQSISSTVGNYAVHNANKFNLPPDDVAVQRKIKQNVNASDFFFKLIQWKQWDTSEKRVRQYDIVSLEIDIRCIRGIWHCY